MYRRSNRGTGTDPMALNYDAEASACELEPCCEFEDNQYGGGEYPYAPPENPYPTPGEYPYDDGDASGYGYGS